MQRDESEKADGGTRIRVQGTGTRGEGEAIGGGRNLEPKRNKKEQA